MIISLLSYYLRGNPSTSSSSRRFNFTTSRKNFPPSQEDAVPRSFVSQTLKNVVMHCLTKIWTTLLACFCSRPASSRSTSDFDDPRSTEERIDGIGFASALQCPISNLCSQQSSNALQAIWQLKSAIPEIEAELSGHINTLTSNFGVNDAYWKKQVESMASLEQLKKPWLALTNKQRKRKATIEFNNSERQAMLLIAQQSHGLLERLKSSLEIEKRNFVSNLIDNAKGFSIAHLLGSIEPFMEAHPQESWLEPALTRVITEIIEKGISGFHRTPQILLEEIKDGYVIDPESASIKLELPGELRSKGENTTCRVVTIKRFTLIKEGFPDLKKEAREVYLITKPLNGNQLATIKNIIDITERC